MVNPGINEVMPMLLHVNPSDELPIYRQIVRQITDAIAGGRMRPGQQLPSHGNWQSSW